MVKIELSMAKEATKCFQCGNRKNVLVKATIVRQLPREELKKNMVCVSCLTKYLNLIEDRNRVLPEVEP